MFIIVYLLYQKNAKINMICLYSWWVWVWKIKNCFRNIWAVLYFILHFQSFFQGYYMCTKSYLLGRVLFNAQLTSTEKKKNNKRSNVVPCTLINFGNFLSFLLFAVKIDITKFFLENLSLWCQILLWWVIERLPHMVLLCHSDENYFWFMLYLFFEIHKNSNFVPMCKKKEIIDLFMFFMKNWSNLQN